MLNGDKYSLKYSNAHLDNDFISLIDIAKYKSEHDPNDVIKNGMKGRTTLLLILPFQQENTKMLDFGRFTIVVPKSWTRVNIQGIDSYVGEIKIDDQDKIGFDLGRYSNTLREEGTKSDLIIIDNKKARVVRPEKSGTGITGVYLDSLATTPYGNIKFQLSGENLKPKNEKLVLAAIQTLKFTKGK